MSKLVNPFLVRILIFKFILSIPVNGAKNLMRPNDIYKFMTLLLKEYYLIPGNDAKNLLTKMCIDQISNNITKGLVPNPRQQCQKLVETIFHMYEKMELFSCKMTHLKFVHVVSITASAQIVQVIKVDI